MATRRASHASEWYSDVPEELSDSLQNWLKEATALHTPARAIIAPHAAYQFSGSCAASAYKQIDPSRIKRVFILGPSHYQRFSSCALTRADAFETPLYDLKVDVAVNGCLLATGDFELMDSETDEKEHSIEMHLPCIAKVMENYIDRFAIVPIVVGCLSSPERERRVAKILCEYLADPQNLFVISSDFCHWGKRFGFTYHDNSDKPLYQCIEELDKAGMDAIEKLDPAQFRAYLEKCGNTICGRVPILILLHAVKELLAAKRIEGASLKFLKYVQSNQCRSFDDCSVSYASASLIIS